MPQVFEQNPRSINPRVNNPTQSISDWASGIFGAYTGQNLTPSIPNNFGYLRNLLLKEMDKKVENPYAAEWMRGLQTAVTTQTRQAYNYLRQQSALSGFRGSVDPNALFGILEKSNALYQSGLQDIQKTNLSLLQTQMALRERAIANLLGLETTQAQLGNQQALAMFQGALNIRENALNRDLQERLTRMQIDAQSGDWLGQLLGGLLQAGSMIGGAYLLKG